MIYLTNADFNIIDIFFNIYFIVFIIGYAANKFAINKTYVNLACIKHDMRQM